MSGSSGNISAYDPQKKLMYITASGTDYEEMTEADIIEMRTDGTVLSGRGGPSSEWRMHAMVYEKRGDVRAVVHTHSPYATGFAVVHKPIPLVLIEMVPFLGGSIPLAEFALPGTAALGERALEVLSDRYGCLLSNHGALTVGPDLTEAYLRAVYLEDAARRLLAALQELRRAANIPMSICAAAERCGTQSMYDPDRLVQKAMLDGCAETNPREFTSDDVAALYRAAYQGTPTRCFFAANKAE